MESEVSVQGSFKARSGTARPQQVRRVGRLNLPGRTGMVIRRSSMGHYVCAGFVAALLSGEERFLNYLLGR